MSDGIWVPDDQHTVTELLLGRCATDPDRPYLDVVGDRFTAAEVADAAGRVAGGLLGLGLQRGDRVASLVENSSEAMLLWWGITWAGGVSVPINTAYKGDYLTHQLSDSGATIVIVQADLAERVQAVAGRLPSLGHVVVIGDSGPDQFAGAPSHPWAELLAGAPVPPADMAPSELATFIYTGGTTGPSKGCMLSHNYHEVLTRQIGYCWRRTADDIAWTPLPLFHFNAIVTGVLGPLVFGGSSAISTKFSVSNFWPEMNRTGATITSTLGTMAYLLAHDEDRPEMPRSGAASANRSLRLLGAAPLPEPVDRVIRERFGVDTFSGAYGLTEASLLSWSPAGLVNKAEAAGVINSEYFDVRIFDDDDRELRATPTARSSLARSAPIRCSRGTGVGRRPPSRPVATSGSTLATSAASTTTTSCSSSIARPTTCAVGGRTSRASMSNASSWHTAELTDVVVHAVPSELGEDDLKITAIRQSGSSATEADLFRFCIAELPYFALPRYIEFRSELPRSPVGRVLKRVLREEGRTPATWCVEDSGITYEKR